MTLLVSRAPRPGATMKWGYKGTLISLFRAEARELGKLKKKWVGTNPVPLPQGQLQSSHALQTFMEVTFISMEGTWCLDWSHAPFLLPTALS